jgi:hypothetical protein
VNYSVSGEYLDSADGGEQYNGTLVRKPINKGSLTIKAGGFSLQDNGAGELLTGGDAKGTINYGTGSWSIDLKVPLNPPSTITADYTYTVSGAGGSGGAGSGASGATIYSFSVQQQGQNLKIVDNNGKTYEGSFGSIRSTGGSDQNNQSMPAVGDSVIGSFEASGVSAAGFHVDMVGTFQGVVSGDGSSLALANRQMFGTWMEDGGRTGDINGESSPVSITP